MMMLSHVFFESFFPNRLRHHNPQSIWFFSIVGGDRGGHLPMPYGTSDQNVRNRHVVLHVCRKAKETDTAWLLCRACPRCQASLVLACQALCQSSSMWKTTVFQGALMFSRIVFMRSVCLHWIYVEVSALPQLAPKQRKCRANNTWWVPSLWSSAWVGSDMDFKFQHQLGLQLDTNLLAFTFYLRSFTSCNTKAIPVATGCKCMWKWFCGNEKSLELAMAAWEFARCFVPRPWTSAA